jgi:putative membrane protein
VSERPYERETEADLILRDRLAVERTRLANERTLLSYLRAGVSLELAGVAMMQFANHRWYFALGVACLPVGAFAVAFGAWRYRKLAKALRRDNGA